MAIYITQNTANKLITVDLNNYTLIDKDVGYREFEMKIGDFTINGEKVAIYSVIQENKLEGWHCQFLWYTDENGVVIKETDGGRFWMEDDKTLVFGQWMDPLGDHMIDHSQEDLIFERFTIEED